MGYDKPKCELPANFSFHSMGVQGDVSEWSTDLRKYFQGLKEEWFVWLMEDTFLKKVNVSCNWVYDGVPIETKIGRVDLTNDVQKRAHKVDGKLIIADPSSNYRLSTQPSIWNKKFLLQYLTNGLTPWEFEKQEAKNDGWLVIGFVEPLVKHNEGVRKFDPHKLDLNGFPEEDVQHIMTLL